jgi:ATP-dependent DNA helicase RecQ
MDISATLQQHFGHGEFRPGQEAVIHALLAGRSALAIFPTGGGKSLCYQLPALHLPGLTLVISPLIALMKDQVESLVARGIAAARLDSTLTSAEVVAVFDAMRSGTLKLLYIAPERLMSESFMERLSRTQISLLAIDESHCISEWGHNFRPEYLRLAEVARRLRLHPVLALTATATPGVAQDICKAFQITPEDQIQTPFHRRNLALYVTPVSAAERLPLLCKKLQKFRRFPAIIYVTLQHTAEQVASYLAKAGLNARAYHAGLPDVVRTEVQDGFMGGSIDIIVATIAFGMGIDKANIRAVYHFNLPKTLENYQQEIGRAGRDGQGSHCEMLACGDDTIVLQNFVFGDTPTPIALRSLLDLLLGQGDEFDISRYDLAHTVDIRPLVLETVLTYLELDGYVMPLGAFYTGYQMRLLKPESAILAGHTTERQAFLKRIFGVAKRGPTWHTIEDLGVAAQSLGEPRERLQKAINWLEETGAVQVRPSGLRHRYRLVGDPAQRQVEVIAAKMQAQFAEREVTDAHRIEQILALAADPTCLTRHLLRYFGEDLEADCGHCGSCLAAAKSPDAALVPRVIPRSPEQVITPAHLAAIHALKAHNHSSLGSPRQLTRYLCGLTSPATTRARISKGDTFGMLDGYPFPQVLKEVEALHRGE